MAGGWSLRPRELSSVTCVLKYLSFELCLCKSSFIFLFHGAFVLQLSIKKKCFVYMSTSCFMHIEICVLHGVFFFFKTLCICMYICIYIRSVCALFYMCLPTALMLPHLPWHTALLMQCSFCFHWYLRCRETEGFSMKRDLMIFKGNMVRNRT